ncbi:MAG: class I SAM-dependent methyltransferase [Candidatus Margulisbacteria bacterium]|nr:class I SAM-dependent methyltransferase [Candidatus Margulisiibacteriota bacterium]
MTIKKSITRFFDEMIVSYPLESSEIIGWSSKETQLIRFNTLVQIADLNLSSILDVGCGVGDLYPFLKEKFSAISYQGIDLHPKMIQLAIKKYPEGSFKEAELQNFSGQYDYVFVSGAFNLRVEDNARYLSDQLSFMNRVAKKGIAFNLLSSYSKIDARYPSLYYYNPLEVFTLCKNRFERVILRHDYLSNDFTIYIYK